MAITLNMYYASSGIALALSRTLAITIVNWSINYAGRGVIYNHNMFIVQATVVNFINILQA